MHRGTIVGWGAPPACTRCGGVHAESDPCPLAAPAGAADPLLGAQVGSFRIVRTIGRGGMGTVYLAEHPAIGSRVAIKFLHEAMAANPELVARFYDEARAVNLVGHENIVAIYDLDVLPPGRYFFVMEYLEGETLHARQHRDPLPPAAGVDVLLQLTDALQCAHEAGVVHRDLKPDNVFLVRRRGKGHFVKLVDFGIAKLRGAASGDGRTAPGLIVGTPEYMAPEQCDVGEVDARTDVYALGVMAYELLTGRLPFAGASVPQLLLAHLREEPPRPSELVPSIDPGLEAAVLRALRKAPGDRFPDMASFGEALEAALVRERARERAPTLVGPAAAPEAARSPSPAPPRDGATAGPRAEPARRDADGGRPDLAAELLAPAAPPRALPVVELTRAALFLRAEDALPPLRSRVAVRLSHPSLRGPLEVAGDVVRHVSRAEAAAWRMSPGFAVQLADLAPAVRAAIAQLADAPATPAVAPPDPSVALAAAEARAPGGHYAVLGVPPDAEFSEIRRAATALRDALERIRVAPGAADEPARATALLARVETALHVLSAPAARLGHDLQRGNAAGVARCVAAGMPPALVAARRAEFLAANPRRAAEAERQLARARVARKLGNAEAAVAAYEAALAADPLDPDAAAELGALRRAGPAPGA